MQQQYFLIAKTPLKRLIFETLIPGLDNLISTQILTDQAELQVDGGKGPGGNGGERTIATVEAGGKGPGGNA